MPAGQDPAVLTVAETVQGTPQVVVACRAGRDRERAHVRAVIRSAHQTSMEGPAFDPGQVTFEDERSG